ncbi:MAG TPA: thiamine pyrophosphate-requiring protein, partial [Candidatus Lustribacter sp.]|nr:thiamine pyrophosphate-requiring protein [Candidatus Lustribacter sp.]
MCHVSVGSANAICAIMNASRDQIPIIFMSGRTPLFESGKFGSRNGDIHWPQEMFDQGGMMREVVKWDYELRDGLNVEQVVDRAYGIAQAAPSGPIYLMLPREVLAGKLDGIDVRAEVPAVPAPPFPSPEHVKTIARRFATAEFPVIVTSASGADPATVAPLAALCERFGFAHVDRKSRFVNVPTGHPMHLVQPLEELFAETDALLFLETDVPWIPNRGNPRPETFIADAGTDPLFGLIPIRSFPADVSLTTTVAALLPELERELSAAGAEQFAAARRERIAAARERGRAAFAERVAADAKRGGPITKLFLSRTLDAVRATSDIVVNEYSALFEHMQFDEPGTWFLNPPAAGLGWGLPAAIGVKLAAPERTVIAVLGDGAYIFANPAACHHAMAMHDLPVLMIVYNNARWEAVQGSARGMYGKESALGKRALAPLSSLEPIPDFERYVEASGGIGFRVTERAELESTIRRARNIVQTERKQVLINVIGS